MFDKSKIVRVGAVLSTVLMLAAAAASPAKAVLLIDAGLSSSAQTFLGGNYAAGTEFTTGSALTIRSLGWLDAEGDGLVGTHTVGLWSAATQLLLASVTVAPTSMTLASAHGTAQWFMGDIAPLIIGAGTYRVAGMVGTIGDNITLSGDKIGNGVTLTNGYVRTYFPGGGFDYPDLTYSSQAIRVTASTDFVTSTTSVPEPGTLALFGLGLAGLGFARRRKVA